MLHKRTARIFHTRIHRNTVTAMTNPPSFRPTKSTQLHHHDIRVILYQGYLIHCTYRLAYYCNACRKTPSCNHPPQWPDNHTEYDVS